MRRIRLLCAATFLLLFFANARCRKEDAESQLPPETTIGAGTFGCKVNGRVFVPRSGRGRPGLRVEYVNSGGWFLTISAIDNIPSDSEYIIINADSLLLEGGKNYYFSTGMGFPSALYNKGLDVYGALPIDSGELKISKNDLVERILSGRFWFKGTNSSGKNVTITEGRFDVRY